LDRALIVYAIPKCGTHFLSQIVALLLNPECNIYDKDELYQEVRHVQKKEFLTDGFVAPRYFNTHPNYLGYERVASYPHTKLFVVRHPLDKSISSFFYRIYNRAEGQRRRRMSNNLNAAIYDYCTTNIDKFSNQLLVHIEQSSVIPNSHLFDYSAFIEDKPFHIERIAEIMGLPCDQEQIAWISARTDFDRCADYEDQHDSFRVGAVQNGAFFRRGANNDFETYLDADQIAALTTRIPSRLKTFYNI
jgi:hypothetical protein